MKITNISLLICLLIANVGVVIGEPLGDVRRNEEVVIPTEMTNYVGNATTIINVTDYGAIADDAQDDTAEIQAAVAIAKTARKSVYFPKGVFNVTNTAVVLDWENAVVQGSGSGIGATEIITTSTTDPVISVPEEFDGVKVLDIKCTGPGKETSQSYGLYMRGDLGTGQNTDLAEISGCRFENFLVGVYAIDLANSEITRSSFNNNLTNFYLKGNCNSVNFSDCGFIADTGDTNSIGFYMEGGRGSTITGCDFAGTTLETALLINGVQGLTTYGCNIEYHGADVAVRTLNVVNKLVMIGLTVRPVSTVNSNSYSLYVNVNADVTAIGCWFGITNSITGASIRQLGQLGGVKYIGKIGEDTIDVYNIQNTQLMDTIPASSTRSYVLAGDYTTATYEDWGRLLVDKYPNEDDRYLYGMKLANNTYIQVDLLEYYKDTILNGAPAYIADANTWVANQIFDGGAKVNSAANPALKVSTSAGDSDAATARFALATNAGAYAGGSQDGDTVLAAKGGGDLCIASSTNSTTASTTRLKLKGSGVLHFYREPDIYADKAAAIVGGLVVGDVYMKSDGTLMVIYL